MGTREEAKTELELLREIKGRLDRILGVLAVQGKDRASQVKILTGLGLSSQEIGELVGIRAESVRRMRSREK